MAFNEKMAGKVELVKSEYSEAAFQSSIQDYMSIISLGLDPDKARFHRYIIVRIYISSLKEPEYIYEITKKYLYLCGFEIVSLDEYKVKSWFSKLIAKTLTPKVKEELLKELDNGRKALQLYGIDKQQAEIDNKLADASAKLIKALDNEERGAIQAGSTLVVKNAFGIVSRTLSQEELQFIEENPDILLYPDDIIKALSWATAKSSFFAKDPKIDNSTKPTLDTFPRLPRKLDLE